VTHASSPFASADELSPEEEAIQGIQMTGPSDDQRKDFADEDADTAALAEGRAEPPPPGTHREEPR
jgi:hypothetical protein